jgi:glucose dehydrogenase
LAIRAAVVAGSLAAVGAGATAQAADWAQFGFIPSHTDYNPLEKVLSPANVAGLRVAWSQVIGEGSAGCCTQVSPVEAGGVVYVSHGGDAVLAYRASTGGHYLWANGEATDDGMDTAPAVSHGVVYDDNVDGAMYALDASTGLGLSWCQYTCEQANLGYDPPSATVDRGVVYIGSQAFSASNGDELWSSPVDGGPAAVAGGVVYLGSFHNVYALRATNGHKLWSHHTGGSVSSPPAVTRGADGVVYYGAGSSVYALRASNGHKLWSYRIGAGLSTLPAVARGVVYLGSGHNVYALRASSGHRLWSSRPGGGLLSAPAVANGVVYVASGKGQARLYALRASNGKKLWSSRAGVGGFNLETGVTTSPVVVNGMVYAGYFKLYVFALKPGR